LGRSQGTGVTPAASTKDDKIERLSAASVGRARSVSGGTGHGAILSVAEDPRLFNRCGHNWRMSWFRRTASRVKKSRGYASQSRTVDDAVTSHLTQFARSRRGVEAFVEPKTAVTQTTLLLVAFDGEWTRRVVPSPEWAHSFAERLQIPGYDAAVVGYPQRMRDYNTRNKKHPDLR